MKASQFEFRFRVWIMVLLVALGFWAPWLDWLQLGGRAASTRNWLWLELSRTGAQQASSFVLVNALVIVVAAVATAIRIWGTAYLGGYTVQNAEMKAGRVLADGPYRYVRNPLYIGSFLTLSVICVLMPPTGAAFTVVLLAFFLFRLILGEEAFLAPRLGEPYSAYCKSVPRLIPRLRPCVAPRGGKPNWSNALLSEAMPLGILISFAVLSWQYDSSQLLERAVLVSFGISLVARALLSKPAIVRADTA